MVRNEFINIMEKYHHCLHCRHRGLVEHRVERQRSLGKLIVLGCLWRMGANVEVHEGADCQDCVEYCESVGLERLRISRRVAARIVELPEDPLVELLPRYRMVSKRQKISHDD